MSYKGWEVTLQYKDSSGTPPAWTTVGRASSVSVEVSGGLERVYGIGERDPVVIKEGRREISGTVEKMFVDTTWYEAMAGTSGVQPNWQIRCNIGTGSDYTVVLQGVKFDTWSMDLPQDDYIVESIDFVALTIGTGTST